MIAAGGRSGSVEAKSGDSDPSSGSSHLQHISDQAFLGGLALEPDLPDHPRSNTIFLSKSQIDVQEKRRSNHTDCVSPGQLKKIYSSCSTIVIDDRAVNQSDLGSMIKCIISNILLYKEQRFREMIGCF